MLYDTMKKFFFTIFFFIVSFFALSTTTFAMDRKKDFAEPILKEGQDQFEARNLSNAIDFLDELAMDPQRPIIESDIRQLHQLVLKGIHDDFAGKYRNLNVEISGSKFKPTQVEQVGTAMRDFGKWLGDISVQTDNLSAIDHFLGAAVAHTWFVTIHFPLKCGTNLWRFLRRLKLK